MASIEQFRRDIKPKKIVYRPALFAGGFGLFWLFAGDYSSFVVFTDFCTALDFCASVYGHSPRYIPLED